jgi:hypothetical protein
MSKIVAAVVFATVVASPAFAQSYDPSVGSGNIGQSANQSTKWHGALGAYAQERPAPHGVKPFTAEEKALFNRIPVE